MPGTSMNIAPSPVRPEALTPLKIDARLIGPGRPTFVVAEIGVNHDGSVNRALELVRIASNCGADAVKLQIFRATTLVHPSCRLAEYQRQQLPSDDPIDMLKRYELSSEDIARVVKAIRDLKLIPLATPFSPTDLALVERLRLPAIKIASPDVINRPLLAASAKLGRPLLVSTGAATMAEVETTCDWLRGWGAAFGLLHCISSYPTPPQDANLCWIEELGRRFDVPIGYSDHTTGPMTGALAAGAGASVVEKHLTYDRAARGPDHATSADPAQFERYVKLIREADALRGVPGKRVLPTEEDVRTVSRQSLVLRRALQPGDTIKEEDLAVQRPGTGVSAALFQEAIGRRVVRTVTAGSILQWDMISEISDAA
jgi:N,N'-diacetyllegionaminate synthase